MGKYKIVSRAFFKSNEGKSKTYVTILDNGYISVIQLHLDTTIEPSCILMKKYKDKYLVYKHMAFKLPSFFAIQKIVIDSLTNVDVKNVLL